MHATILLCLALAAAEPTAATAPDAAAKAAPASTPDAGAVAPAGPADAKASAPAPAPAPVAAEPSPAPAPAPSPPSEPTAPVAPVPEPAVAAPQPAAPPEPPAAPPAAPVDAAAAPAAAPLAAPAAACVAAPEKEERPSFLGLAYEVGFPQGMTAGLVVRPWGWLRIMGGVSTYGVGNGFHGEISLAPLRWYISLPILSVSAGRYASLDLSKIPGTPPELAGLVGASSMQYVSVMTGFEFGNQRHGMLSLQAGVTRMEVDAPGTASFASDPVSGGSAASIEVSGASVKSLFPAFKVGWTLFL